jgi:hypothetical protein
MDFVATRQSYLALPNDKDAMAGLREVCPHRKAMLNLIFALSRIGRLCQLSHDGKERWRLAHEKPHVR